MEKKIEQRKDILLKLIRGNLVLGATKITSMLIPTMSVVGIVVPQAYITLLILVCLSSFAIAINNKKEEEEEC